MDELKLEEKRKTVENLLNMAFDAINPHLIDQEQREVFIDAMWSIMGGFDAEISYRTNMLRKINENALLAQSKYNLFVN